MIIRNKPISGDIHLIRVSALYIRDAYGPKVNGVTVGRGGGSKNGLSCPCIWKGRVGYKEGQRK